MLPTVRQTWPHSLSNKLTDTQRNPFSKMGNPLIGAKSNGRYVTSSASYATLLTCVLTKPLIAFRVPFGTDRLCFLLDKCPSICVGMTAYWHWTHWMTLYSGHILNNCSNCRWPSNRRLSISVAIVYLRAKLFTNSVGCNCMVYGQRDAHERVLRASTILLLLATRALGYTSPRRTLSRRRSLLEHQNSNLITTHELLMNIGLCLYQIIQKNTRFKAFDYWEF